MGFCHSFGFSFVIFSVAVMSGGVSVIIVTSMFDSPALARQRMLLIETDSVVEPFTLTPLSGFPSHQHFVAGGISSLHTLGSGTVPGVSTLMLFASSAA